MYRRQLPNSLTILRLILAGVFFVVLSHYRYRPTGGLELVLIVSMVLFILGAITDWLDGYLARKWHVESTFGRIMDPFCDKVLVIGAFMFLSGPRFVDPQVVADEGLFWSMIPGNTVTGIYPWMVALIIGRELLVTAIRGELERIGIKFPARLSGKLKAILQMVVIPIIMAIVLVYDRFNLKQDHRWVLQVRNVLVYATIIATILSGMPYITGAMRALREEKPK